MSDPVAYYTYDYGDGWIHEVRHVGTHTFDVNFKRLLLAGARAFPKEDCGGLGGYRDCIQFLESKKSPDSGIDPDSFMEWLDGWTPEAFDFDATGKKFNRPKGLSVAPEDLGFNMLPENLISLKKYGQRAGKGD